MFKGELSFISDIMKPD